MTGILIRDRKRYLKHREEGHESQKQRLQLHSHKSRNVKGCQQPPEAKKEAWNRPTQPPEGTNPDDTLVLRFWPSELWNKFLFL